jgi:hypothetical protein
MFGSCWQLSSVYYYLNYQFNAGAKWIAYYYNSRLRCALVKISESDLVHITHSASGRLFFSSSNRTCH